MSHLNHETILENYRETFEEAVQVENWALAKGVIEDLRADGFPGSADVLQEELIRVQNETKHD